MTNLTKVIFACDESGAKGYADQDEAYPGEIGVFAGILIPDECVDAASPKLMEIHNKYKPAEGKLHIADLPDNLKESLRYEIFQTIQDFTLPCFWYAIHVAGLHASHKSMGVITGNAKRRLSLANNGNGPRIKGGSACSNPASMHVELFLGLYGHLIAFLEERQRKEVNIEIRTDQIDNPIIQNFESVAKELLSEDPSIQHAKGWDIVTQTLVEGEVRVEFNLPREMRIETVIRSLSIKPIRGEDGFVLAADVLANSLNHLFKNRQDIERYYPLNSPNAVAAHPLAKHFDAFIDWGEGDTIGDIIYRHPEAPQT